MADQDAQAFLAEAADRYNSLEAAYCQDSWQEVIAQGHRLLADLEGSDDTLAAALRVRAQLLMGHAYLHGLGNRDAAEDHYRLVLNTNGAEAALRRSAEEGLQACNRPLVRPQQGEVEADTSPAVAETPAQADTPVQAAFPPQAAATTGDRPMPEPVAPDLSLEAATTSVGQAQEAAAPWLKDQGPVQAATAALIPDLVEEPELLEVRRAEQPDEIQLEPDVEEEAAAAAARLLAASARAEAMAEIGVEPRQATDASARRDEPEPLPEPALSLEKVVVEELPATVPAAGALVAEAEATPASEQLAEVAEEEEFDLDLMEGLLQVTLS